MPLFDLVPPRIEDGPTEVGAVAGSRVFLMCDTEGIPKPEVTWERDGVEIPVSGPRYTMHNSGSLHFSPVEVEDSGAYRCTATNKAGSVSRDFTLSVQGICSLLSIIQPTYNGDILFQSYADVLLKSDLSIVSI